MRKFWLVLGGCLLAAVAAFGQDTVAGFAKKTLAVDLADFPFGRQINPHFLPLAAGTYLGPPLKGDADLTWYQNDGCTNYTETFPDRSLIFGFKDGRLAAIRVSVNALTAANPAELKAKRERLAKIQAELYQAMAGDKSKSDFYNGSCRVQYLAMCGPNNESLFCATIQIIPAEKVR
jgi:hypothetical protein